MATTNEAGIVRITSVDELLASLTPHHAFGLIIPSDYEPTPFVVDTRYVGKNGPVPAFIDHATSAIVRGSISLGENRWHAEFSRHQQSYADVPERGVLFVEFYAFRRRNSDAFGLAARDFLEGSATSHSRRREGSMSLVLQPAFHEGRLDVTDDMTRQLSAMVASAPLEQSALWYVNSNR
jgi:hypothetical protein